MAYSFKFSADGSEFTRGLNKMKGEVKSFAMSAGKIMAGMLAAGIIVGLKKMADQLDRVGKLSARLGKSAESLQRVAFAANLAGTDIENVANALTKVEQNAGQAMNGLTTYSDAFERLNIDYETFAQLSPEDQILQMAAAYQVAKKEGTGMADVLTIIGGRAKELLPLLSQAPEELKKTFNAASVASEQTIRDAEMMNDTFTTLKNKGFGVMIWFVETFKHAMAGLAITAIVIEDTFSLLLTDMRLIGKAMSAFASGDGAGIKAAFSEMGDEADNTFDRIEARIAGVHIMRRGDLKKKAGASGVSAEEATAVVAGNDKAINGAKEVDKLKKEIAATEKQIRMDLLKDEEKAKVLQAEKADAEKKFLRLRSDALDAELAKKDTQAALYIKELEAKKELLRISKELAGIETKIATGKSETFKSSMNGTNSALAKAISAEESNLSQGQGKLSSLKGQGVESSVIASGLRSIGGGGNATVTRDPSLQIAKRSQSILAQIAKNTEIQAKMDGLKAAQKEVAAFEREH